MNAFREYLQLLRTYPRYLFFGMWHMFYSSPGQSFAVAVFVPSLSAAFGLGAGGFGLLYSIATLASALFLPVFGPMMDRYNLRVYSVFVGAGLMIGCLLPLSFYAREPGFNKAERPVPAASSGRC